MLFVSKIQAHLPHLKSHIAGARKTFPVRATHRDRGTCFYVSRSQLESPACSEAERRRSKIKRNTIVWFEYKTSLLGRKS